MAPKRKAAQKELPAKAIEEGKVKKAAKQKRLSEAAKNELKETRPTRARAVKASTNGTSNGEHVNAYVSFEICKSCTTYKRNANKIFDEIKKGFHDKNFELSINENLKPRKGSFEITISSDKEKTKNVTLIWTGVDKGPPRREKFPEPVEIVKLVAETL